MVYDPMKKSRVRWYWFGVTEWMN